MLSPFFRLDELRSHSFCNFLSRTYCEGSRCNRCTLLTVPSTTWPSGSSLATRSPPASRLELETRPFRPSRAEFESDLASQRDSSVFNSVLYAFVKPVLYKRSIQVFLDTSVQICVHRLGIALCARQNHGNLVRHNLSARDGFRYGFSL